MKVLLKIKLRDKLRNFAYFSWIFFIKQLFKDFSFFFLTNGFGEMVFNEILLKLWPTSSSRHYTFLKGQILYKSF